MGCSLIVATLLTMMSDMVCGFEVHKMPDEGQMSVERSAVHSNIVALFLLGFIFAIIIFSVVLHWPYGPQALALLSFIKRVILAIYSSIPVLILGYGLMRYWIRWDFSANVTWSLLVAWALGWAVIILAGMLLLSLGMYSGTVWTVIAFVFNVGFFIWLVILRWKPLLRLREKAFPEWGADLTGVLKGDGRTWNLIILVFLCMAFLEALIPPNMRDELTYHLVIPRLWEFQQHWWMNTDNYHLLFPANIEMIWGFGLSIGGIHLPRLMTFSFGLLTLALMRRWLIDSGYDPWIRRFSLFFFVTTPLIFVMIAVNDVEWPMILFLLLGYWASGQYGITLQRRYLFLEAVFWGVACGAKYTMLPVVALLSAESFFSLMRKHGLKRASVAASVVLIGFLVFSGPWLLRNFVLTRDPLYPFGQALSVQSSNQTIAPSPDVSHLTQYESLSGFWSWNQWLFYTTESGAADYRMHPGWPLLHLVVLFLGWKFRREKPFFTVLLLSILFFYFTPSPRIFFPLMVLTWLFLPDCIKALSRHHLFRLVVSCSVSLFALSSFAMIFYCWFMAYNRASQDYLMGIMNDETMLEKDERTTPVVRWIRERTPGDSRLWVWCDDSVFYFDRWVRASSPYDFPSFLDVLKTRGAKGLDEEIKTSQISYIVVNTWRCPADTHTVTTEKRAWSLPEDLKKDLDLWMSQRLREITKDSRYRLYKVM